MYNMLESDLTYTAGAFTGFQGFLGKCLASFSGETRSHRCGITVAFYSEIVNLDFDIYNINV